MASVMDRVALLEQTAQSTADLPDRLGKLEAQLKTLSDSMTQIEAKFQGNLAAEDRLSKAGESLAAINDKIKEVGDALAALQASTGSTLDGLKSRADTIEAKV